MKYHIKTLVGFLVFLLVVYILVTRQKEEHVFHKLKAILLRNVAPEYKEATRNADYEVLSINRYVALNNNSLIGDEFTFDAPTSIMLQNVLRNQTFKRKPVAIYPSVPFFDIVVPVTAASSNHFREFKKNIGFFSNNFPGKGAIFYDLGLDDSQASEVKTLPFLTYRKFNFDAYPPHIRNLHNYAWKLLIIQQVLAEFDGAMWFDTSVRFRANTNHILEQMARAKSGILFYVGTTGHSILAATNPGMLKYFPMKTADAVSDMFQASAMIIINTDEVQKHIMKWACICTFKPECIAPPGSRLRCGASVRIRDKYANCHRFDQALMNILAKNVYDKEPEKYSLTKGEEFAVMRRG